MSGSGSCDKRPLRPPGTRKGSSRFARLVVLIASLRPVGFYGTATRGVKEAPLLPETKDVLAGRVPLEEASRLLDDEGRGRGGEETLEGPHDPLAEHRMGGKAPDSEPCPGLRPLGDLEISLVEELLPDDRGHLRRRREVPDH